MDNGPPTQTWVALGEPPAGLSAAMYLRLEKRRIFGVRPWPVHGPMEFLWTWASKNEVDFIEKSAALPRLEQGFRSMLPLGLAPRTTEPT